MLRGTSCGQLCSFYVDLSFSLPTSFYSIVVRGQVRGRVSFHFAFCLAGSLFSTAFAGVRFNFSSGLLLCAVASTGAARHPKKPRFFYFNAFPICAAATWTRRMIYINAPPLFYLGLFRIFFFIIISDVFHVWRRFFSLIFYDARHFSDGTCFLSYCDKRTAIGRVLNAC